MIKSDSIANVSAAFVAAQADLETASKDKANPFFKSKYADLGSVWEACKDSLRANGLAVTQIPTTLEDGAIALTTLLIHKSGEYIGGTYRIKPIKEDPQAYGSALTYARRYALSSILGVVADEDDDGNAACRSPVPKHQPAPNGAIAAASRSVEAAASQARDVAMSASKDVMTIDPKNGIHRGHISAFLEKFGATKAWKEVNSARLAAELAGQPLTELELLVKKFMEDHK